MSGIRGTKHLRYIFYRMGFSDKDMVAPSGGMHWEEHILKDQALVEDPKLLRYVELYAKDEDAFFRDYAASHKKLSELCFISPSRLALKFAVGVLVTATVAILSHYYEVHRRFFE
ncbi:MORC family CW-type zinc finger protein 3 isoform 2 [Hibiscus syriacus]|uniref:MORC family CW-type zinc finger protein 3 isoform 2 n=1 Tax=Hibiscus syriacus TaxID=106335 RepID=A0A6A3AXV0_HIBSY|nr:MORC family CW-type zinc finger protein 3 isoform 2 [Hibiscus syriacus]